MDTAVFGSFSITSFIDLYQAHRASWHDKCVLVELQTDSNGQCEIVTQSDDIDTFKRKYNTSYLFGVLYDSTTSHEIYVHVESCGEVVVQEEYKEKKKQKWFYTSIENGVLDISTSVKDHIHIDDYLSISSIPLNNFDPIEPDVEYSLDIDAVSWKSFGVAGGYGSRNKLKKLKYPRYNKKEIIED